MSKTTIAAMLCAALSIPAQAAPADCPGAAAWCDDFESGAARWVVGKAGAAPLASIQPGSLNHLLQASDGVPLLVAADESAALTQAAWFVEARLRPSPFPAKDTRRAILLANYKDDRNWTGAGIGFTAGGKRLAIELVAMVDGKLVRLKQVGRDTEAGRDFHTLRLELGVNLLSVYLNGELMTTAPAPQSLGRPSPRPRWRRWHQANWRA